MILGNINTVDGRKNLICTKSRLIQINLGFIGVTLVPEGKGTQSHSLDSVSMDIGGRPAEGWEGGGKGEHPDNIIDVLRDNGKDGTIVSGFLAWIMVNRNESAKNIWKIVAISHCKDDDISGARKALREASGL